MQRSRLMEKRSLILVGLGLNDFLLPQGYVSWRHTKTYKTTEVLHINPRQWRHVVIAGNLGRGPKREPSLTPSLTPREIAGGGYNVLMAQKKKWIRGDFICSSLCVVSFSTWCNYLEHIARGVKIFSFQEVWKYAKLVSTRTKKWLIPSIRSRSRSKQCIIKKCESKGTCHIDWPKTGASKFDGF